MTDHCRGLDRIISRGKQGEVYNIGGFNEERNIDIVKMIIDIIVRLMIEETGYQKVLRTELNNISYGLIEHVQDRLGHDVRYAIDPSKSVKELGFYPEILFEEGIEKTIRWYLENQGWVEEVVSRD